LKQKTLETLGGTARPLDWLEDPRKGTNTTPPKKKTGTPTPPLPKNTHAHGTSL